MRLAHLLPGPPGRAGLPGGAGPGRGGSRPAGPGRLARAWADHRGSMSVEMVVVVPVLLLIAMLAMAGGRLVSAEGMVQAASRDAARAASMERSTGEARAAATRSLEAADTARARCSSSVIDGDFGRGGTVTVAVSCQVRLSDLGLVMLPGTTTVRAESTAPVDTWRGTR